MLSLESEKQEEKCIKGFLFAIFSRQYFYLGRESYMIRLLYDVTSNLRVPHFCFMFFFMESANGFKKHIVRNNLVQYEPCKFFTLYNLRESNDCLFMKVGLFILVHGQFNIKTKALLHLLGSYS